MKNKITLLAIVFVLNILSGTILNINGQVTTTGLIGFYSFSHSQQEGNVNDYVSIGGTPTMDRFGNNENAISLDGVSNYLTISNTYDFWPRTINIWFKTEDVDYTNYGGIFISDNPNLEKGLANLIIKKVDDKNVLIYSISGTQDTVDVIPNVWYNACTAIDTDGNVNFYLDGELLSSKIVSNFVRSNKGLENIVLGTNRHGNDNFFTGVIDDIRIYDRQLSSEEIESIYNEGSCLNPVNVSDTLIIQVNLTHINPRSFHNEIKVYPNPTQGNLFINCGENFLSLTNFRISIIDIQGNTVYNSQIDEKEFQINLNNWSGKGLYIINLVDSHNNIRSSKKIILE